jgi:hypothetical protein
MPLSRRHIVYVPTEQPPSLAGLHTNFKPSWMIYNRLVGPQSRIVRAAHLAQQMVNLP